MRKHLLAARSLWRGRFCAFLLAEVSLFVLFMRNPPKPGLILLDSIQMVHTVRDSFPALRRFYVNTQNAKERERGRT